MKMMIALTLVGIGFALLWTYMQERQSSSLDDRLEDLDKH